jgi:hypothetical protein
VAAHAIIDTAGIIFLLMNQARSLLALSTPIPPYQARQWSSMIERYGNDALPD